MNETLKVLTERRSVRSYKDAQVPEETLQQILTAGEYAPSGMGMQPVVMAVVQDKETIRQLSRMNAAVMGNDSDPFYGAPTVVVVFADSRRGTCVEDGSLVMGNLMLAAHSLGIGSCWIHRAKDEFDGPEGKELLKELGIEGDYEGIGHCVLGYVNGEYPETKARKENRVYSID